MTPEFSQAGYGALIGEAREAGYRCVPLREAFRQGPGPTMIARHDIDVSLELGLAMARLERSLGVRSTYCVLLDNDFYDPFSPAGQEMVRGIAALGHEIGLHWDSTHYAGEPEAVARKFRRDLERLGEVAGQEIVSASRHNPIDTPALDIDGLVGYEAYSEAIGKRYAYVSDSAMTWRSTTPLDLIARGLDFQFLAHPVWWLAEGNNRDDKLKAVAAGNGPGIARALAAYGRYLEDCLEDRDRLDGRYEGTRRAVSRSKPSPA
jgi:hypothetical protein